MAELGIKFDGFVTSGHKRAIKSAILARESYLANSSEEGKTLPIKLYLRCHEISGVHMRGKTYPGLNKKEMLELCPDLVVDENQKVTDEEGWFTYANDHIETGAEMIDRIKEVIREMKDWHR